MTESRKPNRLAELLKEREGFISIEEAIEILGAREYTLCLTNLAEKDEDDPEYINLYFQGGDSDKGGLPTHICFSSSFMDRFCDALDNALEEQGQLSPRTKGLTKH